MHLQQSGDWLYGPPSPCLPPGQANPSSHMPLSPPAPWCNVHRPGESDLPQDQQLHCHKSVHPLRATSPFGSSIGDQAETPTSVGLHGCIAMLDLAWRAQRGTRTPFLEVSHLLSFICLSAEGQFRAAQAGVVPPLSRRQQFLVL